MTGKSDQDSRFVCAAAYETDGYVIARNVVDSAMIARAHAHVHRTIKEHLGLGSYEQLHQKRLFVDDPFYLEMVRQPGVLALARNLLGPDLALFAAGYIIKAPGNSFAVLWHQDGNYWPLDPMEVCTLWLAITESNPANGCMRVVPQTHRMTLQQHTRNGNVQALLDTQIDPSLVDESQVVDLTLEPGDVSVHHPNIIHGSNPNSSTDRWRLNLVARVIRSTTHVTDERWPGVFHLCGEPRLDINRYLNIPAERNIEDLHA